jgi:hypothetical protein
MYFINYIRFILPERCLKKILVQQLIRFYNFDTSVTFVMCMIFCKEMDFLPLHWSHLSSLSVSFCHSVDKHISNLHFPVSMPKRNFKYTAEGFKVL